MRDATRRLWAEQDRHPGDRERLFRAVADAVPAREVLYPGSWCDVAASRVWPRVTYVDSDRRAAAFFADPEGVREIVGRAEVGVTFVAGDYTGDLGLSGGFDLLVSLYAGLVSDHCTDRLRVGGWLLANTSHGDVGLASLDARYRLVGVVAGRSGRYVVRTEDLEGYLRPAREQRPTAELFRGTGRGIAYARSAPAYLFRRVR